MKKVLERNTQYKKEIYLLAVWIILMIVFSITAPGKFMNPGNMSTIAKQIPELGFLGLAMMPVFLTGGTNLSNVTTAALSGITTAMTMSQLYSGGHGAALSIIAGLIVGLITALICGIFIGFGVAYVGVAAMLFTLGTMTLFKGIGMQLTKGAAISGFPTQFYNLSRVNILGIPALLLIFLFVVACMVVLMNYTKWGRSVYLIGCNPKVAEYSGIKVKAALLKVYIVSAVMSFLAAIMMVSRYNSAKVDYGSSYLLQSLTACVLGGMDIKGGQGSIFGVVLAVVVLQSVSSGMNALGINRFFTDITTGCILIAVLALNHFGKGKIK